MERIEKADIGMIGLAVMGENLVMNMESKGFTVSVFDRTTQHIREFIEKKSQGKNIIGAYSLEEFVSQLKKPRRVMMMIKAGAPVDGYIEKLLPLLEKGDIIIDGGNSHFSDTMRRVEQVEAHGMLYIGAGISGGEKGALTGPSIMPGGSQKAWESVKPIFQAIAAQVEGSPCCEWVGASGAGHYVKMVHNAIEYGDIQLICEAYHLMKNCLGMTAGEMQEVFREWNKGELDSYLIQITADILGYKDTDGSPLVEKILDTAGQKGTGKWASIESLNLGVPLTLISEAVFARSLSAMKEERVRASEILPGPMAEQTADRQAFIDGIRNALYAAKIVSYAQGYALMKAAGKTYGWELDFGEIALLWRGGCIIRSAFLGKIKEAFEKDSSLENLLLDTYFHGVMDRAQTDWRQVVSTAVLAGIPVPALSSALSYYDGYRCGRLPANLLQAQRDYFGAHTYERTDRPRGEFFHTNWTGEGGDTSASTYNA